MHEHVRLYTLAGTVTEETYSVLDQRPDRKGLVTVLNPHTGRQHKVAHGRILPATAADHAIAQVTDGDNQATCPKCGYLGVPSGETFECPPCGINFPIHWLKGERPVAATATKEKEPKVKKPAAPKKQPKVKAPVEEFDVLALREHGELYTKKNLAFDHNMTVAAHVLLIAGAHSRKLCFNTYNGRLGKNNALPVQAFVQNKTVDDKHHWFAVKDMDKERTKLTKDGYLKQ